jgi:hypothetical protein
VSDAIDRLRAAIKPGAIRVTVRAADLLDLLNQFSMMRHPSLSSEELKLAEKNCNWVAFKHAFNAVMKARAQ